MLNFSQHMNEKKDICLWDKSAYYELIKNCHGLESFNDDVFVNEIKNIILSNKSARVLDVGCGEGGIIEYLSKFSEASFYGIDVAEAGLKMAKDKNIKTGVFLLYGGGVIPYEDDFFDLSYSTSVFEHLKNPEDVFNEMVRVTKKSGFVVIMCPNYGSPFFRSPCNKTNTIFLMLKRLAQGFFTIKSFANKFWWNEVEPIYLSENEHIMDYDTFVEPNLLFFYKHLKYRNKVEIIKISSFWENFQYGGSSSLKRIFFHLVKFLGNKKLFNFHYYGPFFFAVLKKSDD